MAQERNGMDKIGNLMNMSVLAGAASDAFYELSTQLEEAQRVRESLELSPDASTDEVAARIQFVCEDSSSMCFLVDELSYIFGTLPGDDEEFKDYYLRLLRIIKARVQKADKAEKKEAKAPKAPKAEKKAGPKPGR